MRDREAAHLLPYTSLNRRTASRMFSLDGGHGGCAVFKVWVLGHGECGWVRCIHTCGAQMSCATSVGGLRQVAGWFGELRR